MGTPQTPDSMEKLGSRGQSALSGSENRGRKTGVRVHFSVPLGRNSCSASGA